MSQLAAQRDEILRRVRSVELAFDEPIDGIWASDHYGVIADLEIDAG